MDAHPTVADADLMHRLAAGDDGALAELVDRWQRPLLAFTYRYVQDHDAAHELTQETFVRVYQGAPRFRTDSPFAPWVFRIAANLCKNWFRWKARHPEQALPTGEDEAPLPAGLRDERDPARDAIRRDDVARVAAAVRELPHRMKVAVLLHYYDGLSYREIAHVVGCSERGVETRLYRARTLLAARLGIDPQGNGAPHVDGQRALVI